jgi:cell division septal protein FtsQ
MTTPPSRRPAPRPNRGPRATGAVLLLLACVAFLAAAVAGEFRVRHVDVVGASVASDEVVQASDVLGENIFIVRSDQVIRRLASLHDVEVRRVDLSFPFSVTIYINQRTAVIAWNDMGRLFEVDARGIVLRQVKSSSLPLVTGPSPDGALDPGTVEGVRYAAQLWPVTPTGILAAIRYDPRSGLSLVARANWTATLGKGTAQLLVSRIATLDGFLHNSQVKARHLLVVDLRYRPPFARFAAP